MRGGSGLRGGPGVSRPPPRFTSSLLSCSVEEAVGARPRGWRRPGGPGPALPSLWGQRGGGRLRSVEVRPVASQPVLVADAPQGSASPKGRKRYR